MTEQAFERLLQRALLDDAERAVRPFDATAIATGAKPATRSRVGLRAFAPYAAAALIGVALITGAVLVAGSRPTPLPAVIEAPPSPSASPTANVPPAFIGQWMGAAAAGGDASAPRNTALLDVNAIGLWVTDRSTTDRARRFASTVVADESSAHLRATSGDCPATAADAAYGWSLSPGRSMLVISATDEPCAPRGAALTGTWYRNGCSVWGGTCIGHLEPGTYPSWNFRSTVEASAVGDAVIGALTYTVPEGWTNSHDFAAGYWLEPTEWHDALIDARGGIDDHSRLVGNGIYLMSSPVAALQDTACSTGLADPSVGETADDLVAFLTHHPALDVSAVTPVSIGGLSGTMVDVTLKPSWTTSCPGMAGPAAALFTLKNGTTTTVWNDTGTVGAAADRYIVLDLGRGRPILIQVSAPSAAAFERLIASAMPVVETFRFQP